MLQTRIELLAVELAEERERLLSILLLAFLAALFLGLGILIVTALLALWLVQSYGWYAVLCMGGLHLLIGLGLAWRVKSRVAHSPPLFATSLAELNKDRNTLLQAARNTPTSLSADEDAA